MTATAQSSANEFFEFYGVKTVVVPPHTPSIRIDHPDVVFTHCDAKRRAIVREIIDVHALGRPILAGTASVKESEELEGDLRAAGISCSVLNAKNDELKGAKETSGQAWDDPTMGAELRGAATYWMG